MAKTKEEKRAAWKAYYKKNKAKYQEWAKAYRAKHKKTAAVKTVKAVKVSRKKKNGSKVKAKAAVAVV